MDAFDTLDACLESARQLEQQGDFEATLSLYERAEELDNMSWVTRSGHLRVLYQLDRVAEAQRLLDDYLKSVEPAPGAALNDLGVIKAEQGLPWDAARCFVRALRSSCPPCVSSVLGNLAYVLYLENRAAACASACDSALQLDPDDSRPHFLLSAVESMRYEGRSRSVCSVVKEGMGVQVFRLLRFEDQRMTTYHGKAVGEEEPRVRLAEPVPLTRPATPFGFLVTYGDELWCGFSRECGGRTAEAVSEIRKAANGAV